MSFYRFLLALSICIGLASAAVADTLPNTAEVRKATDGIMGSVGAGNLDGAIKQIRMYTILPAAEFDVFAAQVTSQLPNILQRFGPSGGSEFVRQEEAGQSIVRLQYIEKREKSGIRWMFLFYRTDKGWVITDFKFDGNIGALFPGGT